MVICRTCLQDKPADAFSGHQRSCKACRSAQQVIRHRERMASDSAYAERRRAQDRARYQANKAVYIARALASKRRRKGAS